MPRALDKLWYHVYMLAIILILVYTLIGFVVGVRKIRTILLSRKVTFMNLEYTKRELRKFSWGKVALLEIDIYGEVRSPRALESPQGASWEHEKVIREIQAASEEYDRKQRDDAMEVMANNYTEGGSNTSNTVVTYYSGPPGGGAGGSGSCTVEPGWNGQSPNTSRAQRGIGIPADTRKALRGEPVDAWGKPVRRATLRLSREEPGIGHGCCCAACKTASQLVSSEQIGSVFSCHKCHHAHKVIPAD